jgi:hypothetical protein
MKTFPEFRVEDIHIVKDGKAYFDLVLHHSMYCCDVIDASVSVVEKTLNVNLNKSLDVQNDYWIKIPRYVVSSNVAEVIGDESEEDLNVGDNIQLSEDQIDRLNKLLRKRDLNKFDRDLEERETRIAENIVDTWREE